MPRDSAALPLPDHAASLRLGRRRHVLLIEDEPGIADFITRGLHGEGYAVAHVFDGVLGRRLAEDGIFDLVILDWRIPGETGSAVLDTLSSSSSELPIIVTSAGDEAAECLVGAYANPVRFIAKPFAMRDLLRTVRELLPGPGSGVAPTIERSPSGDTRLSGRNQSR